MKLNLRHETQDIIGCIMGLLYYAIEVLFKGKGKVVPLLN